MRETLSIPLIHRLLIIAKKTSIFKFQNLLKLLWNRWRGSPFLEIVHTCCEFFLLFFVASLTNLIYIRFWNFRNAQLIGNLYVAKFVTCTFQIWLNSRILLLIFIHLCDNELVFDNFSNSIWIYLIPLKCQIINIHICHLNYVNKYYVHTGI